MGFTVEKIDTTTAPDSLLREFAAYYDIIDGEDMPGDPSMPVEQRIARWRHVTNRFPLTRWLLRDEDGIVGSAVVEMDTEQNLDNGYGFVSVRPDKRGLGYGRALAQPMVELLEEHGRWRFTTMVKKATPTEDLARACGLEPAYEEKRSRLVIAELDLDLMRSWVERAQERASDYELVYYESPIPNEILEQFCELNRVMNTAPHEDIEMEDEVLTPEDWRDIEAHFVEAKNQLHNLIAVHKPTGQFAGYTQILTQDLQPDLAWQEDTGVDPAHRNRGLGRWLKAAMILRIVDEYPAVQRVDTHNAGSNEPMLNINIAMGFKPIHTAYAWQGELAGVRKGLKL